MANYTRYRSSFAKMGKDAQEELVKRLTQLGEDAIKYALEKGYRSATRNYASLRYRDWLISKGKSHLKAWDDISGNLRAGIGSAVYVDGNLRTDTIRYADEGARGQHTRDGIEPRSGRQVLEDYFKSIHPKKGKNEAVLVCASAMYYTRFLEAGTHAGRHKIKVISPAATYIKKNWEQYTDGIYATLGIKKPASKVIKGDIRTLKDYGYYG